MYLPKVFTEPLCSSTNRISPQISSQPQRPQTHGRTLPGQAGHDDTESSSELSDTDSSCSSGKTLCCMFFNQGWKKNNNVFFLFCPDVIDVTKTFASRKSKCKTTLLSLLKDKMQLILIYTQCGLMLFSRTVFVLTETEK